MILLRKPLYLEKVQVWQASAVLVLVGIMNGLAPSFGAVAITFVPAFVAFISVWVIGQANGLLLPLR